jgi:hypothetical protein
MLFGAFQCQKNGKNAKSEEDNCRPDNDEVMVNSVQKKSDLVSDFLFHQA